jgi:nucleoside-diphosphate-sugar epimerase
MDVSSVSPRTVLLTGASGVIGRAIAARLSGWRVIGLVHADRDVPEVDEVIAGDLALPRLGLSVARWRAVAKRVDAVVHSAALTAWGRPYPEYRRINLEGTRAAVELARAAGAPVYLISTCFVHALQRCSLEELGEHNVVKPYIRSKLESERLLRESDVPHTIFRPTNVIGDSLTGASHRPQIVQALSGWICRGKAPYFPVHPGNLVDVVPLDLLADTVCSAIDACDLGREYWVTYGQDAMSVSEALAILAEHARAQGRPIGPVPVVDATRALPIPLERVPATSRPFLRTLLDVSEVTHACGGVLPSSLEEIGGRLGVRVGSDRDAYRLSLEHWSAARPGSPPRIGAGNVR